MWPPVGLTGAVLHIMNLSAYYVMFCCFYYDVRLEQEIKTSSDIQPRYGKASGPSNLDNTGELIRKLFLLLTCWLGNWVQVCLSNSSYQGYLLGKGRAYFFPF